MKLTAAKIKEEITIWLHENQQLISHFDNWFGSSGPSEYELIELSSKFKCVPNEAECIKQIIKFISNGKNWKRYEKRKFDLINKNPDKYDDSEEEMRYNIVVNWTADIFDKKCENYIARRFQTTYDNFDDRILRVISNETDEEILMLTIFDTH